MLLGDFIAGITGAFGVKPCAPCKQRQAALNAWHAQLTGQAPPPAEPLPAVETFVLDTRDGQVVGVTCR